MKTKTCNYLVNVHTLPEDLGIAIKDKKHHLYETALIYQKLIDSHLLWKIWQIDEYGKFWVAINFMNDDQKAEFHTIAIDKGTFDKIDFEEYIVL